MKNVGIVLAAGRGKRMHTTVQKQYLLLCGKPVLYYSLKVFQDCPFIDEIILVTGKDEIDYCQEEIVRKFNLDKVKKIVPGGKERYHSVYEGLKAESVNLSLSMTEQDLLWIRESLNGHGMRQKHSVPVWPVCR